MGVLTLFIDGNLVHITTVDPPPFSNGTLVIGCAGLYVPYRGAIDNVRVFRGALTDSEVATMAQE